MIGTTIMTSSASFAGPESAIEIKAATARKSTPTAYPPDPMRCMAANLVGVAHHARQNVSHRRHIVVGKGEGLQMDKARLCFRSRPMCISIFIALKRAENNELSTCKTIATTYACDKRPTSLPVDRSLNKVRPSHTAGNSGRRISIHRRQ